VFTIESDSSSDVGIYDVTVAGTNSTFDLMNGAEMTFSITINHHCEPPTSVSPSVLTGKSYQIGGAALQINFEPFAVVPSLCGAGLQYSVALDGALEPYFAEDFVANTFTADIASGVSLTAKAYDIVVTATTANSAAISGATMTFTVTIVDECEPPTSVTPSVITGQSYQIGGTALQIPFEPFAVVPSLCGAGLQYSVELDGALEPYFAEDFVANTFTVDIASGVSLTATAYDIVVTATTANSAAISGATMTFTVIVCVYPKYYNTDESRCACPVAMNENAAGECITCDPLTSSWDATDKLCQCHKHYEMNTDG
jgi:galactitol-specific phosphotransferase system IIB component